MGQTTSGRALRAVDVTLLSSAARTATGASTANELGDVATLRLLVDVTAVSGTTPTLDITVETSYDGSTNWRSLGTFTQKTTVTTERKSFGGCDRYVRVSYTIGGTTPSFTFSIAGEGV